MTDPTAAPILPASSDSPSHPNGVSTQQRFYRSFLVPLISFAVLLGLGAVIDRTANGYTQLIFLFMFVNMILALSLNLVNGFTGQFSLGHAGFMAVGAYVYGFLSVKTMGVGATMMLLPQPLEFLNFPIFAVCGGLVAALAGLLVGLPSLRLRGDYLAIVTLGFGEIIRVVLLNTEAVGGARGMPGVPAPGELVIGDFV
ncbi:MAG: branched-chain amino acid ABC transporter permease, partial [Bdellovibrionaceae bacterium]|nr:branched-chain amino acid ABC transporter permease [Pseudobdellovibrionaceae bacterium]